MQADLKIEQFNEQVRLENDYIGLEQGRLGITGSKATNLDTLVGDEVTTDTWCFLWKLYVNKKGTRTPLVTEKLNNLMVTIWLVLQDIYGDIAPNKYTDQDRAMFDRKTGLKAKRTLTFPPITEKCNASVTAIGGGDTKIVCKSTSDASKASRPLNCTGVEMASVLLDQPQPVIDDDGETISVVKRQEMSGPDEATKRSISTKARFIEHSGVENRGKNLQFFLRWINTKHPEINGPWTGPYSTNLN